MMVLYKYSTMNIMALYGARDNRLLGEARQSGKVAEANYHWIKKDFSRLEKQLNDEITACVGQIQRELEQECCKIKMEIHHLVHGE